MHILWLKTELLHPVDKGGRIRTYQMLRALRRTHQVTYLCLDDGTAAPDAVAKAVEYSTTLERVPFRTVPKRSPGFYRELLGNLFSRLPYAVSRYRSREMQARLEQLVRQGDVDVIVCDFLAPSPNVPHDLPCATVLFQHNVEAMIWERHASVATGVKRLYMGEQWRRMRRFEGAECRRYDHVVAVSQADRDHFAREYGVASTSAVPTGVDTEYFTPRGATDPLPMNLVFTGSMDWLPNEDAVCWFADAVLPLVRQQLPDVTLSVVGRSPTAKVMALGERDASILVTGGVPDVRPYLERAALFVVPIRIGGGTRLKIYEAMAMAKPVVSTVIGAEGLPVRDGEDAVLADSPHAQAAAIVALLRDPARAAAIGLRAQQRVRAEFGWDHVAALFAEACAGAVARHRGASVLRPDAVMLDASSIASSTVNR